MVIDENLIVQTIKKELAKVDFIVLFGSRGKNFMSDLDIGIHLKTDLDLLTQGYIVSKLESIFNRKIDLVLLKHLFRDDAKLCYNIVSKGKVIYLSDEKSFVAFKRETFLYYMDTKPLFDMIAKNLDRRVEDKCFGRRNYER